MRKKQDAKHGRIVGTDTSSSSENQSSMETARKLANERLKFLATTRRNRLKFIAQMQRSSTTLPRSTNHVVNPKRRSIRKINRCLGNYEAGQFYESGITVLVNMRPSYHRVSKGNIGNTWITSFGFLRTRSNPSPADKKALLKALDFGPIERKP